MTRTRSEYRLSPVTVKPPSAERVTRRVLGTDRDVLAALILDAYRGTIDDEGEDIDDALAAVDHYIAGLEHMRVVRAGADQAMGRRRGRLPVRRPRSQGREPRPGFWSGTASTRQ